MFGDVKDAMAPNEYVERYHRLKAKTAKARHLNPERAKHDALSSRTGVADQPKDFDWLEKNIPCQAACPAKTDIPGYLDAVARGDYGEAYRINLRDNVFPAVLGRVCTRPCEPACRHGWKGLGEPVAICFSKRSAADFLQRTEPMVLDPVADATGKYVAVIGGGAAGLAAARELVLLGHRATVFEQHAEAGGMMVQGIPEFRLPRALVAREIEQIVKTGVEIRCGVSVGRDVSLDTLIADHDAVILAAGTMTPHMPADLPGVNLRGVMAGLIFLQSANRGEPVEIGRRVVVIGGGFTSVDCARMAKRLGAETVRMVYRRSEAEMYITPGEVEEMLHEGIQFETCAAPVAMVKDQGRVTAVRFVRTAMGEPDATGRRTFLPQAGTEFDVPADLVLMATGQVADSSWLDRAGIALGKDHTTSHAKVFVAGDFGTGAGSLIDAIAHGKSCARTVDTHVMGETRLRDIAWIEPAEETGRTREMDFIPRQVMPTLPLADRATTAEVETGYEEDAARTEAKRCYLCHFKYEIDNDLCIYCDRCLKVKPVDDCIVKVSALAFAEDGRITGYTPSTTPQDYNLLYIDQSKCIRCGACKDVCPVECISLQKVSLKTVACGNQG